MAAMFLAFGAWSFLDPLGMTSQLLVEIGGPNGAFEMRGVFGGVSFGAALLCAAGALRSDMRRPALWFLAAYMGGYCLARAGSLVVGDIPDPAVWKFVAFEAAVFALAALSLARSRALQPDPT